MRCCGSFSGSVPRLAPNFHRVGGLGCVDGRPPSSSLTFADGEERWWQSACRNQPLPFFPSARKTEGLQIWGLDNWRALSFPERVWLREGGERCGRKGSKEMSRAGLLQHRLFKLSRTGNKPIFLPDLRWLFWLRAQLSSHPLRMKTSGPSKSWEKGALNNFSRIFPTWGQEPVTFDSEVHLFCVCVCAWWLFFINIKIFLFLLMFFYSNSIWLILILLKYFVQ